MGAAVDVRLCPWEAVSSWYPCGMARRMPASPRIRWRCKGVCRGMRSCRILLDRGTPGEVWEKGENGCTSPGLGEGDAGFVMHSKLTSDVISPYLVCKPARNRPASASGTSPIAQNERSLKAGPSLHDCFVSFLYIEQFRFYIHAS
jgi:hypothetical protein